MFKTQRIQSYSRMGLAFIVSVLLFTSIQPLVASAADTTANTLKVTPVRSDIEIKPGEKKTVPVTVANVTSSPITVRPLMNDFIAGDERGTPALILDANEFAPTHSLKRFMGPLPDVTVPAKQSKVIDVVITVPVTAQAGGYFGAVRFAPTNPDGGAQVNLSASVASIILMTVPGPTVDKLTLTDFDVRQNGQSNWYYGTADNLQTTFRLENKGNAQAGPFGKLSVKKGDKVVYDVDFNTKNPRDMILPNSARRWDVPLKGVEGFGRYTVSATLTYGQKNQTIEVSDTFWIIPQSVIIMASVGLALLLALIVVIVLVVRKRRNRPVSLGRGANFKRR